MFPEALKLLPLYTLSLLKQRIFHVRTLCPPFRLAKPTETLALALQTKGDVPFDERAALVSRAETLSVPFSTAYNYAHAFKIDSFRKHCLINGLDDIGLTMAKAGEIDTFESKMGNDRPWV